MCVAVCVRVVDVWLGVGVDGRGVCVAVCVRVVDVWLGVGVDGRGVCVAVCVRVVDVCPRGCVCRPVCACVLRRGGVGWRASFACSVSVTHTHNPITGFSINPPQRPLIGRAHNEAVCGHMC